MCVVKRSCVLLGALVAALLLDRAGQAVAQEGPGTAEIAPPAEETATATTDAAEASSPAAAHDPVAGTPEPEALPDATEEGGPVVDAPTAERTADTAPEAPAAPMRGRDDRRPVPDYDGLPDPGPTPEEVLIWFPRILLLPLYVLTEFVVRRPLGELMTVAEREGWVTSLVSFFTWDGLRAGLVPTAFYDFGLLPSVGLYLFWNDAGAPGHQFRAQVGFGGIDRLRGTLRDRVLLDDTLEMLVRVDAMRTPDRIFQGLEGRDNASARTRYRQSTLSGSIDFGLSFWRRSALRLGIGATWNDFTPDGYDPNGADRSLASALADGTVTALPPGFEGYVAYRQHFGVTLDTREEAPAPQHGLRIDGSVEQSVDLLRPLERSWIRYGGSLSGYADAGAERVFSLHLYTSFVDPLGPSEVPFTELVQLGGGIIVLPAFLPGALIGRSAAALTVRYRWPVWVQLDASLFFGAGGTFGEHLGDFDAEALRLSWGLALQTLGDRDHSLRLTFALGTRALVDGGDIDSVRFSIGNALGF